MGLASSRPRRRTRRRNAAPRKANKALAGVADTEVLGMRVGTKVTRGEKPAAYDSCQKGFAVCGEANALKRRCVFDAWLWFGC